MKLLLDTHVIIWLLKDDARLGKQAREVIQQATSIAISEVSLWEISIKRSVGKLPELPGLSQTIVELGLERLNITDSALETYERLQIAHKDPFDRLLISQAIAAQCIFVSADKVILDSTASALQLLNARQ